MNKHTMTRRTLIASLSGIALYTVVDGLKKPWHYVASKDSHLQHEEPI